MPAPDAPGAFLNLTSLQDLARDRVPQAAFDYIAGGAGDEATLANNREGWGAWTLRHRALVDVSDRSTATQVLGHQAASPVMVAPTAFHKLVHPEGEAATARGAGQAGSLMVASTLSTTPLEQIAQSATGPLWFQLYVYRDRGLTEDLVARAEAAGYQALVVTVDAPVWGLRERDIRNRFGLPEGLGLANFPDLDQEALPEAEGDRLAAYVADQLDPSLTWEGIDWLLGTTDLPIVVKGIVDPKDAHLAADHGCAGLVVSNHGGRQLDHGVPTARALGDVVDAIQDHGADVEVYVDGGIRRGTDVVKALCLGADAVLLGRPILWALALGGAEGVTRALRLIQEEVDNAMALCGASRPQELDAGLLVTGEPTP